VSSFEKYSIRRPKDPHPFPFPQAGEGGKSSDFFERKIPSPILMGEGEGEGNFILWASENSMKTLWARGKHANIRYRRFKTTT
jgi:hypothetical protein